MAGRFFKHRVFSMLKQFVLTILGAGVLTLSGAAMAQNTTEIGTFGAWTAYTFMENGNKVCYMASKPEKSEGDYSRRGEVFALITHRPAEGSKNVFSYITGYAYKAGSDATANVDSKSFTLFTQDDTAWAPDGDTDAKIAEALRSGSTLVVKGTSSRGTPTIDTFSLKGSGAAHDAITKACGL